MEREGRETDEKREFEDRKNNNKRKERILS